MSITTQRAFFEWKIVSEVSLSKNMFNTLRMFDFTNVFGSQYVQEGN